METKDRLVAWMHDKGMKQKDLAKALGFETSYISMIVSGQRVITDAFRWRFAQAFGFDVAAELFGDGEHNGAQQAVREHGSA